jgi:3-(3-hydroxy-phenyl)propionate hydroxylase
LPDGGHTVQNLPLRWADGRETTLMQLLADGTQCIGLWCMPTRAQADAARKATASLPLRLLAIGDYSGDNGESGESGLPTLQADDRLAAHLCIGGTGGFALVRPDAYRAAVLANATPQSIASALRTALALDLDPTP